MRTDLQIRLLLGLVATALCMNALYPWLASAPAQAAGVQADLPAMEISLRNMDADLDDIERDIERLVAVVEATAPGQIRCEWSMIDDSGTPGIGTNGQVAMSPDWESLSNAGWMLKGVRGDHFIFERCR